MVGDGLVEEASSTFASSSQKRVRSRKRSSTSGSVWIRCPRNRGAIHPLASSACHVAPPPPRPQRPPAGRSPRHPTHPHPPRPPPPPAPPPPERPEPHGLGRAVAAPGTGASPPSAADPPPSPTRS